MCALRKFLCAALVLARAWSTVKSTCINSTTFTQTHSDITKITSNLFWNCSHVMFVYVSNNIIPELSNDSFDSLWSMRILHLSYNNISFIQEGTFSGLRQLTHLNISHNSLKTLPLNFFDNKPALAHVDLSRNRITRISLSVFKKYELSNLSVVDLSHNLLTAFEPWAFVNSPIPLVNLSFNNISTFTNTGNWSYTKRVIYDSAMTDLRWNQITTWHDWYLMQYKDTTAGPESIEAVLLELLTDIRENPLHCDCNMYNLVKTISNSFYKYSNNPYMNAECASPPELKGKRIFFDIPVRNLVCNLTDNCPAGCLCQDHPALRQMIVYCNGKNLTEVPKVLPDTEFPEYVLYLGNNYITRIDNVSYLSKVVSLSLPNNFLTDLPDFVMQTVAGDDNAFVNFSNNQLQQIPESTQNIKYQNAHFYGNNLECSCDMLWMVDWIKLAPGYANKDLYCTFDGKTHKIIELDEDVLNCSNVGNIILIVVLSVVFVIVIALIITAKRCPYETKVLLFKVLGIHPSDKYKLDEIPDMPYDMCVSFDENDDYARQWVMKKLFKNLEGKKPFFRLCTFARDGKAGAEAESRLNLLERSRRVLVVLSSKYEKNQWNDYELCQTERLEPNEGRVIFIIYDKISEKRSKTEPLATRLKERKVFSVHDRLLWSKLRYELPKRPCKIPDKDPADTDAGEEQINMY
ncbi:SLIT and NTRK-like protein 6 [Dreissena polymorpha]|uniref:TIR domain-containing protein n=1 Tax=Dreissena polymorpha TaxID=45954 RepID=A0A9D4REK3_DREPO|nr:SLIT and NTRK-like protein 6 [Dreissena polymorpha]KAH3863702.1 hypothetical protein DPMN_026692 [Dreissena polymorpha]